ncbi:MAG: response regulator transcription factor [Actinomycetia bacterium]|nr:response regulator transcription factor [Actinomycetes bacterium]
MTRLLLVDDDPMVRTGLRLILSGEPDLEIVAEAADGKAAEALVDQLCPDLVLMDIRMPVQDGLTTTEHLLRRPSPPAVLVLTTFDSDDQVLRALQAGAKGFLLKDSAPAQMIEAIHKVAAGEPALSPSVTDQVIAAATARQRVDPDARRGLDSLTVREREVAALLAAGRSNQDIADELYVSLATTKATITRIFSKLGVDNRVAAALRIRDAGGLETD